MDSNGILNAEGLWNRRGATLAALFAGSALVGWNFYFFQELLAALVIFSAVFLPILAAAFALVLAEKSGEHFISRAKATIPDLWGGLVTWMTVPPPKRQVPVMILPFGPRLIREFQRMNKNGFRLPGHRAA